MTYPVFSSVPDAFKKINTDGDKKTLSGGPDYSDFSKSHLQGFALYNGYYLITQNRDDHTEGKLYFFDATSLKMIGSMHLPVSDDDSDSHDDSYNHPGGIQVIGDYLLIPIQTQNYKKSVVQLWDLSPLKTSNINIELIKGDYLPASNGQQVGGIGIVNMDDYFLVAACNNEKVYFYKSADRDIKSATFTYLFEATMDESASETSLLRDSKGIAYLINFTVKDQGLSYADWAYLYQINVDRQKIDLVDHKHYICHSSDLGILGVHFRWGAGIYYTSDKELGFITTQRVMEDKCDINSFSP